MGDYHKIGSKHHADSQEQFEARLALGAKNEMFQQQKAEQIARVEEMLKALPTRPASVYAIIRGERILLAHTDNGVVRSARELAYYYRAGDPLPELVVEEDNDV